jgi:hypothetical protein
MLSVGDQAAVKKHQRWDRHDVPALVQQPGKRDLPRLRVFNHRDIVYHPRRLHIGIVILALIAWIGTSKITFRILFRALDLAGQKAPAKGAKGHEGNL